MSICPVGFLRKYDLEPGGNAFYGVVDENFKPQGDSKNLLVIGAAWYGPF